ncbi:MAG: hypothetical protein IJF32_10005, partial [Oscillospiraceae bacterium]|nr:hypothetical protein [Oscillospiraceae bacterium]
MRKEFLRKAVSLFLALTLVIAVMPTMFASAETETAANMSGVRIEYPTCTTNTAGQGKNTSTTFTDSTALPDG